jgi:hypothetical protein
MDCMNSLGEVVNIEDVDDIGGSCWTYIRVSVHGISLGPALGPDMRDGEAGSVSVGDTFLFSVAKKIVTQQSMSPYLESTPLFSPLLSDSICVTHAVPYYHSLLGVEAEDRSARRLLDCMRSPDILQNLGIGDPIDMTTSTSSSRRFESDAVRAGGSSASVLTLPLLTDHPILPFMASEVRFFTAGFVIEKTRTVCLPMMICMEQHVAEMWTVDAADCLFLAESRGLTYRASSNPYSTSLPEIAAPDGLLVIFRLKIFEDDTGDKKSEKKNTSYDNSEFDESKDGLEKEDFSSRRNNDNSMNSMHETMMFNPLKRSLTSLCYNSHSSDKKITKSNASKPSNPNPNPEPSEPHYLAFFASSGSKSSAALSSALVTWRTALRSQGIPEHRGGGTMRTQYGQNGTNNSSDCDGCIPLSILKAFVTVIDAWSIAGDVSGVGLGAGESLGGLGKAFTASGLGDMVYDESIPVSSEALLGASSISSIPGTGFLAMRCAHAYSEAIRLQFPTAGLQVSLNNYSKDLHQITKSGASPEQNLFIRSTSLHQKLLVVVGHPGSGVVAVGGQFKKRLLAQEALSDCSVGSVILDMTSVKGEGTSDFLVNVTKMVTDVMADQHLVKGNIGSSSNSSSNASSETSSVLNVLLITTIDYHMGQADLLNLLTSCAQKTNPSLIVSIGAVVAVVAARSSAESVMEIDGCLDTALLTSCFGLEAFKGGLMELCQPGLCDIAIVVDALSSGDPSVSKGSTGEAYSIFRKCVQLVNPEVTVVRMGPATLRLEDETVDALIPFLQTQKKGIKANSLRNATFRVRYDPCHSPSNNSSLNKSLKSSDIRQSNKLLIKGSQLGLQTLLVSIPPTSSWLELGLELGLELVLKITVISSQPNLVLNL